MAEADADDLDPAVGLEQRAPRVVDQGHDPGVVGKGAVLGPCDEDGVDVVEGRVRADVVDDVVLGYGENGLDGLRLGGGGEEGREQATVVTVLCGRVGHGGVGHQDGEASRGFGGHRSGLGVSVVV